MSDKILNTRIQLKYDTYANWIDETKVGKGANLVLKKGEIAFCEIPAGSNEATTAPTILFKVGDGTSTFKALKWASALAADVYSWAKEKTKPTYGANEIDYTKTIKEKDGEGNVTTKTETVSTQAAIDALYTAIETLSGDAGASIADLAAIINKNKEDISDIVAEIGVASTDDEAATGLYAAIESAQTKADAAYVKPSAGIAETDLASDVKESLNKAKTALQAADISGLATKQEVTDESAIRKAAEDKVLEDAKKYADDIKADLLGDSLAETFNTLKDVQEWVNNHEGQTVTNLTQAIIDEETARKAADAEEARLRTEADAAEQKAREDADTALSDRIKVYEDAKETYAAKSELERVEGIAAGKYSLPNGGIEGDLSANVKASLLNANSALQEITSTKGGLKVSNKNNIEIDDEITFVFDCGDAAGNPLN